MMMLSMMTITPLKTKQMTILYTLISPKTIVRTKAHIQMKRDNHNITKAANHLKGCNHNPSQTLLNQGARGVSISSKEREKT